MSTTPNPPTRHALSAAAVFMLLALPAPAATFTLNPVADAFVTTGPTGNLSGNNYGGAGALSVAASSLSNGEFQSLLRFDFSAAKAAFDTQYGVGQWSIQSIVLQLTAAPPNNSIFNASAAGQFNVSWMQNDSWVEGTGTPASPMTTGITFTRLSSFLSAGDQALGAFSFAGGTNGAASYTLTLASGFDADASAGNLVSLRLYAADSVVSYLSDSRSFGTTSARPLLTITVVPEPGALSLLALGATCGLGHRSRRGKRQP
jgi:hypothetical protein